MVRLSTAAVLEDVQYWQDFFSDLHTVYQEISSPMPMAWERINIVQDNIINVIARIRDFIGPDKITPYIHVMDFNVADIFRSTPFLSMRAFYCQSLELKNSHQSSVLFRQTMKDGGKSSNGCEKNQKILLDILQLELCLTFSCRDRENI